MNSSDRPTPHPSARVSSRWLSALAGIPLVLLGGFVTVCAGLVLGADVLSRIAGGSPQSVSKLVFMPWLLIGAGPLILGIFLLRPSRPHKQFWKWTVLSVLFLFAAVAADENFGPANWHQLFRGETYPGTDAASLKRTIVSPHLDVEIAGGSNVLWCGTFQLAWNEACRLTGGDLRFSEEHPMISALNRHSFTKDSLDEASYVAMAGFVREGIHDKIRATIEEKFHGAFNPRFIPGRQITPRPEDFVAYACLYKQLSFPTPFERLEEGLTFGGVPVSAFGIGRYKPSLDKMYPQVLILDYQDENDFLIELTTKSDGDRLILAKLKPASTLAATITGVAARIAQGRSETASTNDLLAVPRIKLDLTREYSEIEGLLLVPRATNVAKDLLLRSAVQNTVFEMNEKGVELKSEAHMAFGCAKQEEPVPRHKLIFDKPYLVFLQRRDARTPYFALWVDNPEVLVRFGK